MAKSEKAAVTKTEAPVAAPAPEVSAAPQTVPIPEKKKSNKTVLIVVGVLVFFFIVVPGILLAAGGLFIKNKFGDEKATEKTLESLVSKATDSKVDIDSKSGSVSVESKDGDSLTMGSDQKLPSDFPKKDIAFIEQEAVTFALTTTSEGKKNWSMTTTVDRTYEQAIAYFDKTIKEPDYTDVSTYASSETQTYMGKTTQYSVYITVTKSQNSDPTGVTYIVAEL